MNRTLVPRDDPASADAALRLAMARGEALSASVTPVLRHLLAIDDQALFNDEVVARLRGLLGDLARQLLAVPGEPAAAAAEAALAQALGAVPGLLAHLHALALEARLADDLQARLGLDPVVSPLLQALVGSSESDTAALAMKLLAAQARFLRHLRQMQLPLAELPAELLHGVLQALPDGSPAATAVRAQYDEAAGRQALLTRTLGAMGGGAAATLAVGHAGVALFASGLAQALDCSRDDALLFAQPGQSARLALGLRGAGQKLAAIHETLLTLDEDAPLPEGLEALTPARAAALLAGDDRQAPA